MTTNDLKHYYSIAEFRGQFPSIYRDLGFNNKFFTKTEAANTIIANENNRFNNLTLTILEIFEQ